MIRLATGLGFYLSWVGLLTLGTSRVGLGFSPLEIWLGWVLDPRNLGWVGLLLGCQDLVLIT
jgi:hypothetical protein